VLALRFLESDLQSDRSICCWRIIAADYVKLCHDSGVCSPVFSFRKMLALENIVLAGKNPVFT
jgi:hypothetical protein